MNNNEKSNNIKIRVITALILVSLVFIGLFSLPQISFGIITAFIILLAGTEWPKIIGKASAFNSALFVCGLILMMLIGLFAIQIKGHLGWASYIPMGLSFLMWLWLFYWILEYEKHERLLSQSKLLHVLLGLCILSFCWLGLNIIRDFQYGIFLTLFFLFLIWGVDTSAYFVGKIWGKTKLAPIVSPNKTWIGVYAAITYSFIIGAIAALSFPFSIQQRLGLIPLAVIVCLFSIIGDLTVSIFKRNFKLKDTGTILPGHGGFFDRIDSLTAGAPIFALGLMILGIN